MRKVCLAVLAFLAVFFFSAASAQTVTNASWIGMTTGLNGTVRALVADRFGNVYVGGDFDSAGGLKVNHIAKWNGSSWSALGSGIVSSIVTDPVFSLAVDSSGNLYIGGLFTSAGGKSASNVAKWNGSSWSALGSGISSVIRPYISGSVQSLSADRFGNVYAGGLFITAGGVSAKDVARWNGSSWSALGSGIWGWNSFNSIPVVYGLAADVSGNLYAAGYFDSVGTLTGRNTAYWNGSSWSMLGSGTTDGSSVFSVLCDPSGNVFFGGYFYTISGCNAKSIARWNGSSWSSLGGGLSGTVFALARSKSGILFAGGDFYSAGLSPNRIAYFNGSSWNALGDGLDGPVLAAASDTAGNLYVGGRFTTAGGKTSVNLAKCLLGTPSVPVLLSPADGSVDQPVSLSLSWNAVGGAASYGLQVSTDSNFSTFFRNQTGIASTSQALAGLAYNTRYYWRVNASNMGGTSAWSNAWSFTTLVPLPPLAPTLLSPAYAATNMPVSDTLRWNAVAGADYYTLQVSTLTSFRSFVINQSAITATSYVISGLLEKTSFFWRVSATNAGGMGAWSDSWFFTTVVPTGVNMAARANSILQTFVLLKNDVLTYGLARPAEVQIIFYDFLGRAVLAVNRAQGAGCYSLALKDCRLSSGYYLVRFKAAEFGRLTAIVEKKISVLITNR